MKYFRTPVQILALLFLIAFSFTTLYLLRIKSACNPEKVTETVADVTQQRWEELVYRTDDLLFHLVNNGEPDLITHNPEKLTGTDISLYLLKDGKVIFWSDNKIPLEEILDDSLASNRVVRLQNGWFQRYKQKYEGYTVLGLSLIKQNYPYDNEYLKNRFQAEYKLEMVPKIIDDEGSYSVSDSEGNTLFSLEFDTEFAGNEYTGRILFTLFLITFILLLLLLLHLHIKLNPFIRWPDAALVAFMLDAIIVRGLIFYFRFPDTLHHSILFSPNLYASSVLNPSLGDLFLNITTILLIAFSWFRFGSVAEPRKLPAIRHKIYNSLLFIAIASLIYLFACAIKSIIVDSTLSFNFRNLLSVDIYSYAGLFLMVIIAVALMLFLHRLFVVIRLKQFNLTTHLITMIPATLLLFGLALANRDTLSWIVTILFLLYSTIYLYSFNRRLPGMNQAILLLILMSLGLTGIINTYNSEKELNHRLMVAANYAQKDDPMAEFLFAQARDAIYRDTLLAEMILQDSIHEDLVITYIIQNFFGGGDKYWSRFNFQVTICNNYQKLVIENTNQVIDCYDFFYNQIRESGEMTLNSEFALIYDQIGQSNYLGVLMFENVAEPEPYSVKVFIEIFPKIIPVDVGYLELLVDQSIKQEADLNRYANARYHKGQLIASYGKYIYSIDLQNYAIDQADHYFFSKGGYSHLYYKTGEDNVILVSLPEEGRLDIVAPFSLFLLVFIILLTISYQVRQRVDQNRPFQTNFKNRLQLTLLAIIITSFIVIGTTSVYYISVLNKDKNMDNLKEKARSIRIEVEHKLADKAILDNELKPYIQTLLIKFNDVFATDINLFDVDGNLLGSSRQKIFNEGLLSNQMNPYAYREMALHKKTLFIHEENIGALNYLSAYIPFKNNQGRIIAYINLPYFARQSELSDEISSFMMAFINIYLLLIAITIIFAFLISDMIAKPLILMRQKIQQVKLGASNERIQWQGYDEIADLVNEYNRMIDELEKSAGLLARSERESAWREMARQVAHEIKNPLTPMKLNLQHLEKTLAEGDPDWKRQFEKYANMMHQQIESLSEIASAFSNFANMPKGRIEDVDLMNSIQSAITLFEGYPGVTWVKRFDTLAPAVVKGDSEQINRMIINLINNSVQAKIPEKTLTVTIEFKEQHDSWLINVHDNGKGIDDEIRSKIFLPSFTTKSSGMGLGLAIARSVVESMGGTISFSSDSYSGTTFTVTLPK